MTKMKTKIDASETVANKNNRRVFWQNKSEWFKKFWNSSIKMQRQRTGPYCSIVTISTNQTAMLHDTVMLWKQNKREILKQVCSSYLQLWFVTSWRSLPVNFFFKMSAAFERKSTVLYGDATPSPSLTLFHCLSSQLLVCWINTLLSPSYVTEASKLLRRSPRPDADQQEARIIRIYKIKKVYISNIKIIQRKPFRYPCPPHASRHSCMVSLQVHVTRGLVADTIAWISETLAGWNRRFCVMKAVKFGTLKYVIGKVP